MKLTKIFCAVTAALAFGVPNAMALSVSSAVPGGPVLLSDNSAEYMISGAGDLNAATLDVGDSLRGIFSIDNITGSGPQVAIGTGTAYNELTGLFQVVVTGKTAVGGGRFNFTFGFDSTFGQGAGVVGVLRDDAAQDFARINCATTAACEATATGGSLWATVGFGADGFWSASNAVDTPGLGALLPLTTPLGSFSLGLDFITNNTGYEWNKVACVDTTNLSLHSVDVCGQGGLLASGSGFGPTPTNTPYDIFDNVDFTMNRIPEPGSMLLLGAGLLGLGLSGRRKKTV